MLRKHGTDWSRAHLKRYARAALAGFLILAIGIGGAIYSGDVHSNDARKAVVKSGQAVSVAGCNRDFSTITSLRGILIKSAAFQKAQHDKGKISDEDYKASRDFYRDQLAALPLPDCRLAQHTLSDDPNKPVNVPFPRYPGDGNTP